MRIAIVGAGIAGLSTALSLRQDGMEVVVYERDKALNEAGAGIQIPPNASIHLARLGLLSKIRQHAFEPRAIQFRRYATSELLQDSPCAPLMEQAFGYPYLLIHRCDYQQILYNAAVAAGINVLFAAEVEAVDENEPAVLLKGSQSVRFDLIVGADGVHSKIRQSMTPAPATPVISSHCAYRALITTELMESTPFGKELLNLKSVNVWLGPQRHIVGYRISNAHYNLVMIHPGSVDPVASWNQQGSAQEMRDTYADFDLQLRSVLALISDVRAWKLLEMPELPRWSSGSGKVVLVGDAAHAMLPYAAQGAAQAIEDAVTLSSCLANTKGSQSLSNALEAFERLRKTRVSKISASARMNQSVWELPDGLKQSARDQGWKEASEARGMLQSQQVKPPGAAPAHSMSVPHEESKEVMFRKWMWGTDVTAESEAEFAMRA